MNCPVCNAEMELFDTTYSSVKTVRAEVGQHTGDIYKCEVCLDFYINDFLNGKLVWWA